MLCLGNASLGLGGSRINFSHQLIFLDALTLFHRHLHQHSRFAGGHFVVVFDRDQAPLDHQLLLSRRAQNGRAARSRKCLAGRSILRRRRVFALHAAFALTGQRGLAADLRLLADCRAINRLLRQRTDCRSLARRRRRLECLARHWVRRRRTGLRRIRSAGALGALAGFWLIAFVATATNAASKPRITIFRIIARVFRSFGRVHQRSAMHHDLSSVSSGAFHAPYVAFSQNKTDSPPTIPTPRAAWPTATAPGRNAHSP